MIILGILVTSIVLSFASLTISKANSTFSLAVRFGISLKN